jgi:serine/threonine-protein kinase
MGTVYEAVQTRLGKRVAVKVMARDLAANTEALARFRREIDVTAKLAHPNIIQVSDFGTVPTGEPYLIMELLEGEDLEQRLERVGRLPLASAVHIVRQLASALSVTHAEGIVHRDLKPANVFLVRVPGDADFVKVVDFGISKVLKASTTKLTRAQMVVGTPEYMSPEQAAGQVDAVDHRSDQWSLSCIVWRMLVGQQPFVGPDVNTILHQVMNGEPPPLGPDAARLLPGQVEAVLRRAVSKRQQDRFPTITAFARSFEAAAAPHLKPSAARDERPAPARSTPAKSGGRLWKVVVVSFGIALVVGAAAVVQLGKLPFMGTGAPAPEPRTTESPSATGPTVIPLHTKPRGKPTHGR